MPSEQDLFRFGREAIISKSNSSSVQFLEMVQRLKSKWRSDQRSYILQIFSFDFNEIIERVLKKRLFVSTFNKYFIFCVPISDYDCFIGGKGFSSRFSQLLLFLPFLNNNNILWRSNNFSNSRRRERDNSIGTGNWQNHTNLSWPWPSTGMVLE